MLIACVYILKMATIHTAYEVNDARDEVDGNDNVTTAIHSTEYKRTNGTIVKTNAVAVMTMTLGVDDITLLDKRQVLIDI